MAAVLGTEAEGVIRFCSFPFFFGFSLPELLLGVIASTVVELDPCCSYEILLLVVVEELNRLVGEAEQDPS
jgi:hypothetical protein